MIDSRTALKRIFSSVNFLAIQGLALRGHDDTRSNLNRLLKFRADDVPELKSWLDRSGCKWLHHDIINEILALIAGKIISLNVEEIKSAPYFSLMIDETSDIARLEQVSICVRIVSEDLSVKEIFMGFVNTESTKAETLFKIVDDFLRKMKLDMKLLRGQCYDGASNVSGKISGLQARIREIEPRALFVHCSAHTLNLVVQDAIEDITAARNFIGIVKGIINFIRDSPKRQAEYRRLQSDGSPALSQFCPTRYSLLYLSY